MSNTYRGQIDTVDANMISFLISDDIDSPSELEGKRAVVTIDTAESLLEEALHALDYIYENTALDSDLEAAAQRVRPRIQTFLAREEE